MRPRCPLAMMAVLLPIGQSVLAQDDPLPSWNDGSAKRAILEFVGKVTERGGPSFVPPEARIATFDNDGTLWAEQPAYVQAIFTLDRGKALAEAHPEWCDKPAFKAALAGDLNGLLASSHGDRAELMAACYAGMTTEEFDKIAADWIAKAKHPRSGRPYTEMVYQPMLELLAFLKSREFGVYIVSGGGIEFMRPWTEAVYGIPPERVIGSAVKLKYSDEGDKPALLRLPEIDLFDDGPGKPVGIQRSIGRRPILAFGNSDGDYEMLRWTTSAPGPRLGLILHHTDEVREWAYDRTSPVGRLARGIDDAPRFGWVVVDMKAEWKKVFPFDK